MEWRTTQLSRSLKGWFWLGSQDQELPDQNDVLLSLRTALDEVPQGIVLLDASLRARFINRAFRAMWRLPDTLADNGPAFATLLYHGRDMRAYDVPGDALDSYIQRRLTQIRNGDSAPVDLHLARGDIIRCQCTKLPNGGRMLSYIDVTELVRRADNLERLRAALDNIEHGIILLDRELNVEFMNAAVCRLWQLPDTQPGGRPAFSDLVGTARQSKCLGMSGEARACALATHGRWIYATKMDASSARNAACYPTAVPMSTLPISSGVPMTRVDLVGRLDFRSASPPGRNSDTFGH